MKCHLNDRPEITVAIIIKEDIQDHFEKFIEKWNFNARNI